jgi:hypothetical protein
MRSWLGSIGSKLDSISEETMGSGVCRFCGRDAGMLRSAHGACEGEIRDALASYFQARIDLDALTDVAMRLSVYGSTGRQLIAGEWDKAIDRSLEDGVLSSDEEKRVIAAAELFALGQAELNDHGTWTALTKAATLRELFEGNIPQRMKVSGLSLVLQTAVQRRRRNSAGRRDGEASILRDWRWLVHLRLDHQPRTARLGSRGLCAMPQQMSAPNAASRRRGESPKDPLQQ